MTSHQCHLHSYIPGSLLCWLIIKLSSQTSVRRVLVGVLGSTKKMYNQCKHQHTRVCVCVEYIWLFYYVYFRGETIQLIQ